MEEILKEIRRGINEFEATKRRWPRMKTQDVIDLLKRIESALKEVD